MLYSDFCDAFTPKDPYYSNDLNNRQARFLHSAVSKYDYFSRETRNLLFNCLRVHFEAEESIELLKARLTRRPRFNVRDCFQYLDVFNHSMLTKDGFIHVIKHNKVYTSESEVAWLFDRFDKNRNGRINYQEFMEEIMPKKSLKGRH
jgi:hypothetical protein